MIKLTFLFPFDDAAKLSIEIQRSKGRHSDRIVLWSTRLLLLQTMEVSFDLKPLSCSQDIKIVEKDGPWLLSLFWFSQRNSEARRKLEIQADWSCDFPLAMIYRESCPRIFKLSGFITYSHQGLWWILLRPVRHLFFGFPHGLSPCFMMEVISFVSHVYGCAARTVYFEYPFITSHKWFGFAPTLSFFAPCISSMV